MGIVEELKRRERLAGLKARANSQRPMKVTPKPKAQPKVSRPKRPTAPPRVAAPLWTYDETYICESVVSIISGLIAPKHSLEWLRLNGKLTPELHVLLTTPLEQLASSM